MEFESKKQSFILNQKKKKKKKRKKKPIKIKTKNDMVILRKEISRTFSFSGQFKKIKKSFDLYITFQRFLFNLWCSLHSTPLTKAEMNDNFDLKFFFTSSGFPSLQLYELETIK